MATERVQLKGACRGYKRGNIFQVWAGPAWEQTSQEYDYQYSYAPMAELEDLGSRGRLKVDGHREWIDVKRVRR